jgi:hypothetical protein
MENVVYNKHSKESSQSDDDKLPDSEAKCPRAIVHVEYSNTYGAENNCLAKEFKCAEHFA